MHGHQSTQQGDLQHLESMEQQQCVPPTGKDHQGQVEAFLQHPTLGELPGRLQFLSSESLLQGVNQQITAEDLQVSGLQEDLHCSGCQDSASLQQEDPQGELQSQLGGLNLEETNVLLMKRPKERELYHPFDHHDVKGHVTDIRYPEPLATEESPRRRARSLPWNSIPEEDEEDSLMCCCKLKKKVQFADTLGLTLASVKHFLPSDEPLVPQAVLARLQSYPPTTHRQRPELILEEEFGIAELAPSEATPAELLKMLGEQGVCLEQVSVSRLGVSGYVLVKDPGEKAQVKIRYTFNEWLSFLDCPATPAGQSAALPPASGCQRFHFNLCYPPSTSCIHFAICFSTVHGQEIWDNNKGANYTVNCRQDATPEIQPSSPDQDEWEGSQLW
ncbi:protein phosphatase 1 regulatory subunit 3G [Mantella aurantiaca]